MTPGKITWPEGKRFAFTIFDDPDSQFLHQCRTVYSLLRELGLRTTVGVWVLEPGEQRRNSAGETCANPEYRAWIQELQRDGFEVGFHNAGPADMEREEVIDALDKFQQYFGSSPVTMANHYNADAMYWGAARLSGFYRRFYQVATLGRQPFRGDIPGQRFFWGDLCQSRIRYCRNFVFRELNTLRSCPWMPYRDPERPLVNYWYASASTPTCRTFLDLITESALDALEAEGGAAIVYTHFGRGFFREKELNPRVEAILRNVAKRNGWFVPVGELLRYLESQGNGQPISPGDRHAMERRWLINRLLKGGS